MKKMLVVIAGRQLLGGLEIRPSLLLYVVVRHSLSLESDSFWIEYLSRTRINRANLRGKYA
jgi:hypothetical protein